MRRKIAALQLILLSCITQTKGQIASQTQTVPKANPARPTVSTPATLTPVGYLQFETGMLGAVDSAEFDARLGMNEVIKLTGAPRLELILPVEPFVRSKLNADKENHPGEVFAGMQGVLVPGKGKRPTISLSYFRRIYASPAPDVDIGTFRQNALILISHDLWGFHFDENGIISEQIQANVHRAQYGQTLSISHPIRKFTISGEIWHFSQPFMNSNAVGNLSGRLLIRCAIT